MTRFAIIAAATASLSWLLTTLVRVYAVRGALLDMPNERSSHATPTPRGGGLGLIVAFVVALAALMPSDLRDVRLVAAIGGVALTAVAGWRDDRGGLSVRVRLVAHIAAALLILPMALRPEPVPAWLGVGGAAIWWTLWTVSAINVVNFIDGIDGLIGLQALVFGVHCWWLGRPGGLAQIVGVALAAASAGFLLVNWAPAKIFLGDVGSGALGVVCVVGGLLLVREGAASIVTAYLPLFAIFLDAAATLIRRARRGERLTVAHRSHLYQRLANGRWGHARVSVLYGLAAALGSVAVHMHQWSNALIVAAYLLAVTGVGVGLARAAATLADTAPPIAPRA